MRLAELARLAGAADAGEVLVESLQARGVLRRATLSGAQVRAADALLALRVNGADLTPDHGFPARIIVPALPGVHCTKWVERADVPRARGVRRYGASPLHLVAHVAAFALAGWAILKIAGLGGAQRVLVWFAAAVILHDLVLLPAYTALDRVLQRLLGRRVNACGSPRRCRRCSSSPSAR